MSKISSNLQKARNLSLLSLMAGIFFSGASWANSVEDEFFAELPVVLSASRLVQPLPEAPNAMTVIDREMIEASGFRTVADLFRLVPGMYVANASGWQQVVGYHGATDDYARRMQVLVDGRSVFMPPIGAVAWENLPLQIDDIERIEVIRGPAAASHGGNSTQGVINIFTRDAGVVRSFKARVSKGNGGISDASVSIGRPGDNFDYRISAGYRSDDGYDVVAMDKGSNNDSHKTRLFNLRANYRLTTIDNFDVQVGYTNGSRLSGHPDPDLEPVHEQFTHENFAQLTWLRSMDNGDELQLKYYHIYQDVLNEIPAPTPISIDVNLLPPLPGLMSAEAQFPARTVNFTNTRAEWELQHTIHTSPDNRLVWGGSARRDWTRAENYFREEQNLTQHTLFAHDEWRFSPQWLLNIGAMQEDSGMGEKNRSPRMALIHHLTDKQSFRIGMSQAYRNPSVYENRGYNQFSIPDPLQLTTNLVPWSFSTGGILILADASGDLRPESILSREMGYLGEFPEYGLFVDARLYYDTLKDIIIPYKSNAENVLGQKISDVKNTFDAHHKGFELSAKHHWDEHSWLIFNYTYQLLSNPSILSDEDMNYNESMPRNMISALYSYQGNNGLAFSLGYYQQDAMLPIDRGLIDKQQLTRKMDVRLAKKFQLGRAEGEIAWVVQGLFDDKHIEYKDSNVVNRRTYLTGTLSY